MLDFQALQIDFQALQIYMLDFQALQIAFQALQIYMLEFQALQNVCKLETPSCMSFSHSCEVPNADASLQWSSNNDRWKLGILRSHLYL